MFDIEYKGANAVVFTTKKVKIVFDPKLSLVGVKDVAIDGAVQMLTDERFEIEGAIPKLTFRGPGEYEVEDVSLVGVAAQRHIDTPEQGLLATIYRLTIGEVKVAVIGNVAPKLDEDQLEALGMVDVVVIPVGGGGYTLDASDAAVMVRQIEPRAVIPVHYADSVLKYEVPQEDLEVFIKELGAGIVEAGPKHKIKGISGLPEQLSIIKVARS